MNLKLAAVPILALVVSLSTIGFVNAESNDTSTVSGQATSSSCSPDEITAAKQGLADIKNKMENIRTEYYTEWQTAHNSGQYNGTFEQYSHEKISSSDLSQLKSDYEKYSSILRSCGGMGHMMKPTAVSATCSQDEIAAAKQGLADIKNKMANIRTEYHTDWQTAHDSGQYNGTFEQYSHEKISSSDLSQIKTDYQKYNSILRSCGGMGHMMKPITTPNTACSQDDIAHARQELATSEKQGYDLKNKIYLQFQADQASGQFNGTWSDYAKEKFLNLPEVVQIKATHEKFSNFLKSCFGNQMPPRGEVPNPGENTMPPSNTMPPTDNIIPPTESIVPPIDQSESLSTISSPTDALGTVASSHTLPGWVKGIAGWWAQGKISDDEFVRAIQFLVHSGIIKI